MQLNYVNNFGSELGLADMQERDPKRTRREQEEGSEGNGTLQSRQDSGLISGAGERGQKEVGGASGKRKQQPLVLSK